MPRQSIPLFVDPEDVILRMQLDKTLTGITDVITSGIIAAQLHVERVIDGKLARQSQQALYFLDGESFSGIIPNGAYRLELPSGLVRQDVLPVVTSNINAARNPFVTFEEIDPTLVIFDFTRGYVFLDKTYKDCHIRVECDTGYETGTTPFPTDDVTAYSDSTQYVVDDVVAYGDNPSELVAYVAIAEPPVGTVPTNATYWAPAYIAQEAIPDILYEAIMCIVPVVFNAQQTTTTSKDAKEQYKTLTDHANLLLQPYVRTKGLVFRPV